MNALEKYVAKTKLAHALTEKLAARVKGAPSAVSKSTFLHPGNIGPAIGLAGGAGILGKYVRLGRKNSSKASEARKKLAPPGRRGPEWKVRP